RRVPGTSTEWILNHVRADQDVFVSEIVQAGFLKTNSQDDLLKENYFVELSKAGGSGLKRREFPLITTYGGVVRVSDAVEKPVPEAKVLFDITAAASPDEVNKGL